MPQAGIPLVNHEESGHEELAGASPAAHNVIVDEKGAVRRRPGIVQYTTGAFDSAGDAVQHIHRAFDGNLYVITGDNASTRRDVYRLNGVGAGALNIGNMSATGRLVSVETEGMVCYAGGVAPYRVDQNTHTWAPLGGSPPNSTHVAALALRLVMNDVANPGVFRWSDIQAGAFPLTGHETWPILNQANPSARPDRVVGLDENTNELFVWGETTLQVYAPTDASIVGVPVIYDNVATREYGLSAPYSIVKDDQSFVFLDHRRRFIATDGRGFEHISAPIQKSLESLSKVSDCFGYRVTMGAADCLVWTFPTDQTTFVFQRGTWGRWTGWDAANDLWKQFAVNAFHHRSDDNTPIVGTLDGRVGKLSWDAQDDLGEAIKSYVRTGFIDRDTDRHKHCRNVRLALKRGHTTNAVEPKMMLSFRDEPGDWISLDVPLGESGDTEIVVSLPSLGTYRRRQWQIDFAGPEELVLARVTEEFDILEY